MCHEIFKVISFQRKETQQFGKLLNENAVLDSWDRETRLTANLINVTSLLLFAKSQSANFTQHCTSYLKTWKTVCSLVIK